MEAVVNPLLDVHAHNLQHSAKNPTQGSGAYTPGIDHEVNDTSLDINNDVESDLSSIRSHHFHTPIKHNSSDKATAATATTVNMLNSVELADEIKSLTTRLVWADDFTIGSVCHWIQRRVAPSRFRFQSVDAISCYAAMLVELNKEVRWCVC